LLAPLAASSVAHAEPTAEERAAARALFDEGRNFMAAGNYAAACPKLEESLRIDAGIGTQYNLADCQEHLGKLASAWGNFIDAASRAKAANQDERAQVARERAAALAPRLSKLIIVATDPAGTLVVKRDGAVVTKAVWGTALPLDPGDHVVSAVAPGKKPWQVTVSAKTEGASLTVTVPALVDLPPEPARPVLGQPGPAPSQGLGRQRVAAIGLGAVGFVGLVLGTTFGVLAKSKYDSSLEFCRDPSNLNRCTAEAKPLRDGAIAAGNASTAAFVIGGIAVAGGVALWVTVPKTSKPAPKAIGVQADLGAGQMSLSLTGRY
jgi:tetratricopeptide (TPR) repeat protein